MMLNAVASQVDFQLYALIRVSSASSVWSTYRALNNSIITVFTGHMVGWGGLNEIKGKVRKI
jgi:hypothetical protein